jgi:hypothetical protein
VAGDSHDHYFIYDRADGDLFWHGGGGHHDGHLVATFLNRPALHAIDLLI